MAFLRYSLLRVLVFAVVAALLWIVGLRGFWLLLFAIFLSGLVSIFVLTKSRDAASASLANRVSEIKRRMADKTAAEDAWADARSTDDRGEPARPDDEMSDSPAQGASQPGNDRETSS